VEVKLGWRQTCQVRVLDEALGLGSEIVLSEMRQCSAVETKLNTLTFDVLLTDTSHNLGNVHVRAFRTGTNHVFKTIV